MGRAKFALLDGPKTLPVDWFSFHTPQRRICSSMWPIRFSNGTPAPNSRGRPGRADAEDHAPLRDLIQRRHLMGQQHWIAQHRQQDRRAYLHTSLAARDGADEPEDRAAALPAGSKPIHTLSTPSSSARSPKARISYLVLADHDAFARRQQVSKCQRHLLTPCFI